MVHHGDVGLYDRVPVENKCCKCGAPINLRVANHLAKVMEETKEAECWECNHQSKWKRQRRCDICDCFEGEHTTEYKDGRAYLICKNCGECSNDTDGKEQNTSDN